MWRQVLNVVLQGEVESMRRRARRATLVVAAGFLLLLAFVFALVSLFLWLATHYAPWLAALIVVAVLLTLSVLLLVAGHLAGRRKLRRRADLKVQAAMDEARATNKGDASLAAMAAVIAIGFAVGRGISK